MTEGPQVSNIKALSTSFFNYITALHLYSILLPLPDVPNSEQGP